ncbi:MAG: HAD family phosphatase [Anaerolineaceae bacterium]
MAIDTIIFDFGGVLINLPDLAKFREWSDELGVPYTAEMEQVIRDFPNSPVFWDIMRGKVSEVNFWSQTAERFEISHSLMEQLLKLNTSPKNLNQPLLNVFSGLKGRYKLGILSNASDSAREIMIKLYHFDQFVDEIIISAEEGFAKPEREIYEIAVNRLDSKPETCLFVDDMIENILAAQSFGMQTIHHTSNENTIALLSERLNGKR